MSLGDSMKKLIGIEEYDDDDEITDAEIDAEKEKLEKQEVRPTAMADRPRTAAAPSKTERRFSMTGSNEFKLILIEPKTFDECPKLVDSLKGRRPVIINLEKLETEVARKIFDFLSGATYALNGNVQKVANNIFIFAPENVDIAGGQISENGNFDFGAEEKRDDNPWR
ncbi:MAG: cell division protein SepF [Eubacterium sp.]